MPVFERTTLDNGLRLLTASMPQVASTTCFVFLAAGSRYETAETNGIAHFAEHMFFKGTERRPTARDIGMAIDGIGGEFNAFTGKEYTGYYVRCASEHQGIALDVLTDMLRHSKFEPEEIEREKGVIVEEMNMYFDTPRDYIGGVYDDAALRRPAARLGHHRPQGDRSRRDARDVPRLHRPLVQAVADGRRHRRAARRRRARRGRAPARRPRARRHGAAKPPLQPLPNGSGPHVKLHTKQSDQAHLVLGVPSRPLDHPDRYILQILATVLGGGMSSRLFTEVRERRGLAYYVYAINHSYTDAGSLHSQAGVDINRIDEAVTTIVDELKRIVDEEVPADELEKAKNFAKGRFVLQLENPQGLILFGLRREVLEGSAIEPDEVLAQIDAVTAEDVQRVAQEVLGSNALRLALIGPFEDAERFEKLLAV